jgi:hypothetical protein
VRPGSSELARYGAACVFFVAALALAFHVLLVHPGSRLACCFGDGTSSIRVYWAAAKAHSTPFTFNDALNGAPQGFPSAPVTTLALSGVQTAFVWVFRTTLGFVGAWNTFLFIGILGTALAMFALLRRLGCTFFASLFGSYVFAFSPYELERAYAGHLGLMQGWVLVLCVAALLRFRAQRTLARAAVVGAAIALAFYLSAYEGLLASVLVFAFLLVELARLPARLERRRSVRLGAAAYGVCGLALTPILVLYASQHSSVVQTASHPINDTYDLGAKLSAYLLPSPRNPLFHWLRGIHPGDLTEQTLFFGYTTAALAVAAVVLMFRRDRWLTSSDDRWWAGISMVLLALIAFWMSFPPTFHVGSYSIATGSAPLALLTSYWRAYSRLGLLVGFALATLAAFALTAFAQRPGRLGHLLAPIALAVAVVELLPGNLTAVNTTSRPPWIAWLASQPRGIVAAYPMPLPGSAVVSHGGAAITLGSTDYWYQRFDDDPAFEFTGLSQTTLLSQDEAIRMMSSNLDDPLTARVLAAEQVRYVVVHDDVYRADDQRVPELGPRSYALLRRFGAVSIYRVHAPSVNIAKALMQREAEIARLQGIKPPALRYQSGFGRPQLYAGLTARRLAGSGEIDVGDAGLVSRVRLTGRAASKGRPETLEVLNAAGRVLARQIIPASPVELHLGPFTIPQLTAFRLTLHVGAGAADAGGGHAASPGLFLSRLAVAPLPVYLARWGNLAPLQR